MNDSQTFWMLYAEGAGAPTQKHETQEAADAEAVRLLRTDKRIWRVTVLRAEFAFVREDPPIKKVIMYDAQGEEGKSA